MNFLMNFDRKAMLSTAFQLSLCMSIVNYNAAQSWEYEPDLAGKYCEGRTHQCCIGREDECSAPILDTVCYCDDFCTQIRNADCCPDYWTFCKGIAQTAPEVYVNKRCFLNGQYYNSGEEFTINCNICTCRNVNGTMDVQCDMHICISDENLIDNININYRRLGWRPTNYSEFWGRKYDEGILFRLGTLSISRKKVLEMTPIKHIMDGRIIPKEFDARVRWPNSISPPRDQGWCGASWVFSTVAVASDRLNILTFGNDKQNLSPQHLLSCNNRNQQGCKGGHLTRAWIFIRKYGLVPENCYKWNSNSLECKIKSKKKKFRAICPSSSYNEEAELHRFGPVYRIAGEQQIMFEIMGSGPVQAVMKVNRDFFSYKTGIYKCSNISNSYRSSYHSVRIIGWGEETQKDRRTVKYWIVSNSWGEWWGEDGYFRIQRGTNECHIEDSVIAAWATIDNVSVLMDTTKHLMNANRSPNFQ